jgi:hypothetical protein
LSNVEYHWNYYQQYATPTHPYDRAALIAYANGAHNTTTRDANGHLLLDYNHDGEIDVSNAGHAFQEHNGRGAGDTASGTPFSNFWFDDNWLARYASIAYGQTSPDGLSTYTDFTRWRILGGDTTAWILYNSDYVDTLALDGLYYLATGDTASALTKWSRIRDKSGYTYDTGTARYLYPNITENYHLGLFLILTEQVLAAGSPTVAARAELVQHALSVRSQIILNQQLAGTTRTGWTSAIPAGSSLMNTESVAANALALGAGATATYEAGQAPLRLASNGYVVQPYGGVSARLGQSTAGYLSYGPYDAYPAGSYTVDFLLRSPAPAGTVAHLDIYDATAGRILTQQNVTASALTAGNQWSMISVPVTVTGSTATLEFRTWWYATADLDLAQIRLH